MKHPAALDNGLAGDLIPAIGTLTQLFAARWAARSRVTCAGLPPPTCRRQAGSALGVRFDLVAHGLFGDAGADVLLKTVREGHHHVVDPAVFG